MFTHANSHDDHDSRLRRARYTVLVQLLGLTLAATLAVVIVGWGAIPVFAWIGGYSVVGLVLVDTDARLQLTPRRRRTLVVLGSVGLVVGNSAGVLALADVIALGWVIAIAVAWPVIIGYIALDALWPATARHGPTKE